MWNAALMAELSGMAESWNPYRRRLADRWLSRVTRLQRTINVSVENQLRAELSALQTGCHAAAALAFVVMVAALLAVGMYHDLRQQASSIQHLQKENRVLKDFVAGLSVEYRDPEMRQLRADVERIAGARRAARERAEMLAAVVARYGSRVGDVRQVSAMIDVIHAESTARGVDPWLVMGIASVESDFNPAAVGPENPTGRLALGVMQVMPFWVDELPHLTSPDDLFDPRANIIAGVLILKRYMDGARGNLTVALWNYGGAAPASRAWNRYPHKVFGRRDYLMRAVMKIRGGDGLRKG